MSEKETNMFINSVNERQVYIRIKKKIIWWSTVLVFINVKLYHNIKQDTLKLKNDFPWDILGVAW